MATIVDICHTIEGLITAGLPDYRPDVVYKLAPRQKPLDQLPASDTWHDTTRSLRVIPSPRGEEGHMNGWDVDAEAEIDVAVRYQRDEGAADADETLCYMIATDARRIVNLVLRPNAATGLAPSGAQEINIFLKSARGPYTGSVAGLSYLVVTLQVRYLSPV